jgi:dihydrofolate reductase
VEIIIIAARSENHVIGKEGGLPWHIPAEEKHYHDSIRGHWGVVGRKSIATEKNQASPGRPDHPDPRSRVSVAP